ncbi:MAG: hypothetical protein GXD23_07600 [Comamonadaceae bacterium]|jgi:hypothetical protein|nr:hypothetical protein [Comamonadaceae bacterium]
MPFKLSRQHKSHHPKQPSAQSLPKLNKFLQPQAPAARAPKTAKPGFKHSAKAFFKKHFHFNTTPRVRDAQQCVIRTVVTDLPRQDLPNRREYRDSLRALAQPQPVVFTTADSLPQGYTPQAYAAALAEPFVSESAAVPPEPASTQELQDKLKACMQAICHDMLAKGEDRRVCTLGDRTVTARIEMPQRNNPDKRLMFGILDSQAIDSRGKAGVNAVLFDGTLHLNGRDVAQHPHPRLALLDASDAARLLQLA